MVAVTLAVAAVTAVSYFADRLQTGIQRDARNLLGGDVVLASDNAPPPEFVARAHSLGLRSATSVAFPTMARATDAKGGAAHLVALKAVEVGYPLRGTLTLAKGPAAANLAAAFKASGSPGPHEAWVDAAVLDALQLAVGDALLLGDSTFRIAAIIVQEPDRGAGFMGFAPRAMIGSQDLAATGLVQPASRLNFRLALAGSDTAVQQFTAWADATLKAPTPLRGVRLESVQSGRPELSQTLERADKFLRLVALLAALLSAVAVALAARFFATSHLDDCAVLRVLGLRQRTIAAAYAVEFILAGWFSSLLGAALGFGVHFLLISLMAGLLDVALPTPGLWPLGLGLGVGLTLLLAFGLPPVLQLAQVPPLRVMRRDVGQLRPVSLAVLLLGVGGFSALLLAASRDLRLGLIVVGGFAAAALLVAAVSWLAIRLLRRSVNERSAPRWLVMATRQIAAQPAYTVVQTTALALGMLTLVLLVLLRTDLIDAWRQATPANAPNRFVINVMPDQASAFRATLERNAVRDYDWFPMIRGRLVQVNDHVVSAADYTDERAKRLVDREFNLSHSAQRPPHNPLVAGAWVPEEADAVSLEEGLAKNLNLHLGDWLVFEIAGVPTRVRVTSIRRVDWSSMRANFFAMFPVSRLPNVPLTYMAAYRAPDVAGFDNAVSREFPNVTNVDVSSTLQQLQRVLDQVARAVEFLFGFTLAAGLVVLVAAVGATHEERSRAYAIMRAVGASTRLLRQVQRAELAGVGLLGGLLASLLASAIGWGLARYVFDFAWSGSLRVLVLGSLAGAALTLLVGWWSLRGLLRRPVVETLRKAAT